MNASGNSANGRCVRGAYGVLGRVVLILPHGITIGSDFRSHHVSDFFYLESDLVQHLRIEASIQVLYTVE